MKINVVYNYYVYEVGVFGTGADYMRIGYIHNFYFLSRLILCRKWGGLGRGAITLGIGYILNF